jgi:biopolymer transport protein ExbD
MVIYNRPLIAVILALLIALAAPFVTGAVASHWPGAAASRTAADPAASDITVFGDETIWKASKD